MRLSQVKNQPDTQDLMKGFKEWRAARVRGQKIPVELWRQTVSLARKYPPNKVARAMGLNPKQLEKHLKSSVNHDPRQIDLVRVAPVQLSGPAGTPRPQGNSLVAELTTANGTHLRIFSGIDKQSMQVLSSLLLEGV